MEKRIYTLLQTEQKTQLSRQRIKYYRQHGFIPVRTMQKGTRLDSIYTDDDINVLARIKKLQGLGISLKAIKTIIDSGVSDDVSVLDQLQVVANKLTTL